MQLTFWGAARTVGGSRHLVALDADRLCRIFLLHGEPSRQEKLWDALAALEYEDVLIPEHGESVTLGAEIRKK